MIFIAYISLIIAFVDALFVKNPLVGSASFGLFFIITAYLTGKKFFPSHAWWQELVVGGVITTASYTVVLTIVFYFTTLSTTHYLAIFLFVSALLLGLSKKTPLPNLRNLHLSLPPISLYLYTAYALSLGVVLYLLITAGTTAPTHSVWLHLTPLFWIALVGATATLFALFAYHKGPSILIALSAYSFVIINIANLVYRIGFGYDPFVHQATEQLLLQTGTITPTPLYYIGHYTLVTFLHTLTHLPLHLIDRFLPSLLFAVTVPTILYTVITKYFSASAEKIAVATASILAIPALLLVTPTPQASSLVFGVITMALMLLYAHDTRPSLGVITLCGVATFALHPITAFALVPIGIGVLLFKHTNLSHTFNSIITFLLAIVVYPTIFYLASSLTPNTITLALPDLSRLSVILFPFARHYTLLDLVYLAGNAILPLVILAQLGYLTRTKKKRVITLTALSSLGLFLSAVIMQVTFVFTALVSSEQSFFTQRILLISAYLGLPALWHYITSIEVHTLLRRTLCGVMALLILISVYLSYPRFDDYDNTQFISVSQSDSDAVHLIRSLSDNPLVLANQMTAVTALKEFGFTYSITLPSGEEIFRYPIPTGQHLHTLYQELITLGDTEKTLATIREFTGEADLFLVVPTYWRTYAQIRATLSHFAHDIYATQDHIIFHF